MRGAWKVPRVTLVSHVKALFVSSRNAPPGKDDCVTKQKNGTNAMDKNDSRGDWLGMPANIKVENNDAVGYVESSLTVHNPIIIIFLCSKIVTE